MYEIYKAKLPEGRLGDDRCVQMNYYGHGDILLATWNGPVGLNPFSPRDTSTRFGFAHGNDVAILASFAGYLKRLGRSNKKVRDTMHIAGEDILQDRPNHLKHSLSVDKNLIQHTASGKPLQSFDIPARSLACLVIPMPSQPGLLERSGGTGIYTRKSEGTDDLLVFAGFEAATDLGGRPRAEIDRTADFCEQDIPTMAGLVCKMALGDYRKDIRSFLTTL